MINKIKLLEFPSVDADFILEIQRGHFQDLYFHSVDILKQEGNVPWVNNKKCADLACCLIGAVISSNFSDLRLSTLMQEFLQNDILYEPYNGLKTVVFQFFKSYNIQPLLLLVTLGKID